MARTITISLGEERLVLRIRQLRKRHLLALLVEEGKATDIVVCAPLLDNPERIEKTGE